MLVANQVLHDTSFSWIVYAHRLAFNFGSDIWPNTWSVHPLQEMFNVGRDRWTSGESQTTSLSGCIHPSKPLTQRSMHYSCLPANGRGRAPPITARGSNPPSWSHPRLCRLQTPSRYRSRPWRSGGEGRGRRLECSGVNFMMNTITRVWSGRDMRGRTKPSRVGLTLTWQPQIRTTYELGIRGVTQLRHNPDI